MSEQVPAPAATRDEVVEPGPSHGDTATTAQAGGGPETRTSDAVTAADRLLDQLTDLPLDAHPDVYERVHVELQGALAEINDA